MMNDYLTSFVIGLSIMWASASTSYASENNFCTPKAQQECLLQLPARLCGQIKQACEGSRPNGRTVSTPIPAVYASQKVPPLPTSGVQVPVTPPPGPQSIFIRADTLDNPYPGLISPVQALGASFNYTVNDFVQTNQTTKKGSTIVAVSSSQSVNVSGLVSYAFVNPNTNYAWNIGEAFGQRINAVPSFWTFGNGNWDHPTKSFGDTSALKVGGEMDFHFSPISEQESANYFETFVGIAPFHQTDFYGLARADGATVSITPSNHALFLMGAPPGFSRNTGGLVDGFVELRGEATYLNVSDPGATLLHPGPYEWFGGAARSYVFFFPKQGAGIFSNNPYLADKLSFVGTYQYYHDANSNAEAKMFSAALQYKIGGCDPVKCQYGSPSVAFQYDVGTDKDTLQYMKKFQLKLNYAW
jgi:hypothetical protein